MYKPMVVDGVVLNKGILSSFAKMVASECKNIKYGESHRIEGFITREVIKVYDDFLVKLCKEFKKYSDEVEITMEYINKYIKDNREDFIYIKDKSTSLVRLIRDYC